MDFSDKINSLNGLIDIFSFNINQYKSSSYDESNTRTDFIDKFFAILDWDVANSQGNAEQYRDVVREDKVRIEGKQKAPDYSFRIGGTRKFFVEAKKPSVNIKEDKDSAFQVRRYGYTAKLPISILTDFEEFAIYDTRIKPDKNDNASVARIFYCTYQDYQKHFEMLYATLSKPSILRGSFDKYVNDKKNKRGTGEVDKELLKLVEEWRIEIAKNIAIRNPSIDIYNLNLAVQKIIDRIIFLRIAEDKDIEEYEQLLTIAKSKNAYLKLNELFQKANIKYNSGLFKYEEWLATLNIDDKVFSEIITGLYYPDCPYEFSILPIEILGNIYEQFLGKVIRFKSIKGGHTAIVEEKPEVRKAGGVYYTPQYIVDYIVKNTVGKRISDKSPITVSKIKICDPACGSGSFLVGAYTHLLKHHLSFYTSEKNLKSALKNGKIYQISANTYKLTIDEKQRILLDNIFGVDIDPQAVEVTKLSLYLKLLENESREAEGTLFKHSDLKLLPTLEENIKCGNSLISKNFYDKRDLSLFDDEEMRKINVFTWAESYSSIFANGGFEVIIGNPPYIFARDEGFTNDEKQYYISTFKLSQYQLNTYFMFFERSYKLLMENGVLGFIIPNNWLTIDTASNFRKFVLADCHDTTIVNSYDKVFQDASVDTSIVISNKAGSDSIEFHKLQNGEILPVARNKASNFLSNQNYIINFNGLENLALAKILNRVEEVSVKLETLATVSTGLKAYQTGKGRPLQTEEMKSNRVYHASTQLDNSYVKYLEGKDVQRYFLGWSSEYLSYGDHLAEPRRSVPFSGKRILIRQIPSKLPYAINATYTEDAYLNDINSMVIFNESDHSLKYLLAVINSRLLSSWFNLTFGKMQRNIFPQFKVKELSRFPIKKIDFSNKAEAALYNEVINLVDQTMDTQRKIHSANNDNDKRILHQRFDVLNQKIDTAIYSIYGLTDADQEVLHNS